MLDEAPTSTSDHGDGQYVLQHLRQHFHQREGIHAAQTPHDQMTTARGTTATTDEQSLAQWLELIHAHCGVDDEVGRGLLHNCVFATAAHAHEILAHVHASEEEAKADDASSCYAFVWFGGGGRPPVKVFVKRSFLKFCDCRAPPPNTIDAATRVSQNVFAGSWREFGPSFTRAETGVFFEPFLEAERTFAAAQRETLLKQRVTDRRQKNNLIDPNYVVLEKFELMNVQPKVAQFLLDKGGPLHGTSASEVGRRGDHKRMITAYTDVPAFTETALQALAGDASAGGASSAGGPGGGGAAFSMQDLTEKFIPEVRKLPHLQKVLAAQQRMATAKLMAQRAGKPATREAKVENTAVDVPSTSAATRTSSEVLVETLGDRNNPSEQQVVLEEAAASLAVDVSSQLQLARKHLPPMDGRGPDFYLGPLLRPQPPLSGHQRGAVVPFYAVPFYAALFVHDAVSATAERSPHDLTGLPPLDLGELSRGGAGSLINNGMNANRQHQQDPKTYKRVPITVACNAGYAVKRFVLEKIRCPISNLTATLFPFGDRRNLNQQRIFKTAHAEFVQALQQSYPALRGTTRRGGGRQKMLNLPGDWAAEDRREYAAPEIAKAEYEKDRFFVPNCDVERSISQPPNWTGEK